MNNDNADEKRVDEKTRIDDKKRAWRERHAATVMGAVLFGLLGLVMMVQAC